MHVKSDDLTLPLSKKVSWIWIIGRKICSWFRQLIMRNFYHVREIDPEVYESFSGRDYWIRALFEMGRHYISSEINREHILKDDEYVREKGEWNG